MLSPFGTLLVNQHDEEEDNFNCSELSAQYPSNANTCEQEASECVSHRTHTLDGDLEDMIAEELPHGSISSEIQINGRKTTKPQALRQRMMHCMNRLSTDQLKWVQELTCFNPLEAMSPIDTKQSDSSPSIHIGNPITVLVECEKKLYLAVAHINQLHFAGNGDLMTLCTHLLVDTTAKVSFQILHIVPTTIEDDPSKEYDWCWAWNMEATCHDVPGELIQPINPEFVYKDGKAMYLLDSNFLLTVTIISHIAYWGKPASLQRVLEHMGAHILYDSANLQNQEHFSCSIASESMESSPCTNFPTNCSLCPPKSAAVWMYSLDTHFSCDMCCARKDDESGSEDKSAMNRVCEGEESGNNNAVEKSGMGEDVECPTDKAVRKQIRSIIHDPDSDGNNHDPLPVAHSAESALETTDDCDLEIHINPQGIDIGCNLDPVPVPQAILPEGNDNSSQRTCTCGQKRP
ncbi:uncharacterized protein LACBIDRAFT_333741 [Laccaria bicolor S238N-H82]|uniref:Predicted protein n=1 Tax=Laccaria bicolor (strain S238N-H82 / ATCC MYA-4686) TaxID=486041 RepID=B0DWX2_LACBS|nr:uncharacterized protein LACBIDRAFT_333741 [Laccaria bicolor S238N-H82]EDR00884.1 predicted protein [Laccaria bicolor S238N-H82]|eukprot:XP_001888478.1 predicted protein [Laccaria bicolor S238N-H82]